MARGDINIKTPQSNVFTKPRIVAAGTTSSMLAGTPVKESGANVGLVVPMVDGDGTTSQRFAGIAKADSNETATVAGRFNVWTPIPGTIYSAKAKVFANANTQALVDALNSKRVVFDLTGGIWTIDTAAADASTNSVICAGGEYQTGTIYFQYSPAGTSYF